VAAPTTQPDARVLAEIISAIASSLDLEEVLRGVVKLLSDASGVHACFVYLVEDDGQRLVLRAASEPFGGLVGSISLERGEGLAWWSLERREPAFIRENALADPRFKYVRELAEERFQSLVAVPVLGRGGTPVGAITLHTEAPREFTRGEVDTLVSSASLVAGAIENARLYAETSRRVHQLEQLTELGETIARAESLDQLLPAVAGATVELLDAASCAVYLLAAGEDELRLAALAPAGSDHRPRLALAELGPELASPGRPHGDTITAPLLAGDALRGLIRARARPGRGFAPDAADLARTAASQTAVAIQKIELIEHLTEKHAIRDFLEDLARGTLRGDVAGRAKALGVDLDAPHVVLAAALATAGDASAPGWAEELEAAVRRDVPGALLDRRDELLRGLLPVRGRSPEALLGAVRAAHASVAAQIVVGLSGVCRGARSFADGFEEARHALLGAAVVLGGAGVLAHAELGPYRYLLRMAPDAGLRDPRRDAVVRLAEYDRQRSTALLRTLEEFLHRRGSISATSEALFVHPNTLRQRLRRITELTGLDLRREDWLALEIAVKLVGLERALRAGPHLEPARGSGRMAGDRPATRSTGA
jgi:GAF domain-containing protein